MKLHIREYDTDKIVHSIDITGKSQCSIEKIMLGLLRRIDTDTYYIDDNETD